MSESKKTFVEWCRQYTKESSTFWQWKHSASPIFIDDTINRTSKYPEELEPIPDWKLKQMLQSIDMWRERQRRLLNDSLVLKP